MYQIISEDVTLFNGDAILNSLGYGPKRIVDAPGGVFYSILNRVNDAETLKKEVYENGAELPISSAFLTNSFGLQCKHIVHVISPFRDEDDEELDSLKETYLNALKLAYSSGIRSICLPLIGTGANGYRSEESFKAAREVAYAFGEDHKDFDVYVTVFWGSRKISRRRNERIYISHSDGMMPSYPRGPYGGEEGIDEFYSTYNPEGRPRRRRERGPMPQLGMPIESRQIDMDLLDLKVGDSFGRLIDLFIIARDGDDSEPTLFEGWKKIAEEITGAREDYYEDDEDHTGKGGNFKSNWHKHPDYRKKGKGKKGSPKKKLKRGEEDPDGIWSIPGKLQILLTACALNMTKRQTEFLYRFCGYYLSKYNPEDLAIKACFVSLATETEDSAILDAYQIYYEKTGKTPFVRRKDTWVDPK